MPSQRGPQAVDPGGHLEPPTTPLTSEVAGARGWRDPLKSRSPCRLPSLKGSGVWTQVTEWRAFGQDQRERNSPTASQGMAGSHPSW